jgi:biotin transport system substrate-specific component
MSAVSSASVLVDVIRPTNRTWLFAYQALLVALGVVCIALSAQAMIPLPFTPVPVTLQTLAVLLIGALYGSRRGALTVATYIACGALGLPVFAAGGFGLVRLAGPTGGYLLGFIVAAFLVGWLAERGFDRKPLSAGLMMITGTATIFAFGLSWLAFYVGAGNVFAMGLLPFIPGAVAKILVALALLPAGWSLLKLKR